MDNLLPLWLAYATSPKDSGKVHSSVRQRFANGEPAISRGINDWKHRTFSAYSFLLWSQVVKAMSQFAPLTTGAMDAFNNEDHKRFAETMSQNFNLRRGAYGDAALGQANLRMIQLASEYDRVAKFPGPGDAIVDMRKGDDAARRSEDLRILRWSLEKEGFVYVKIEPKVGEQ